MMWVDAREFHLYHNSATCLVEVTMAHEDLVGGKTEYSDHKLLSL
jgi:hypothetical protein